jgi:hypothetical protein
MMALPALTKKRRTKKRRTKKRRTAAPTVRTRHRGAWSEDHVRRLFWRAGFGATPAEARRWAARGRAATLQHVLAPDGTRAPLTGPAGMAIDPPCGGWTAWSARPGRCRRRSRCSGTTTSPPASSTGR